MKELSPEAREWLAAASGVDDPSSDDRARVRRALMVALATGAASAVGGGASTAAASSAVAGSTVSGGAVGAGAGSAAASGGGALGAVGAGAAGSATGLVAGASGALGAKVLAVFAVVGVGTAAIVARPFADEPRASSADVTDVAEEGDASPEGAAATPNHRRAEQPSAGASALDLRGVPGPSASRGGAPAAPAAPALAASHAAAGAAEVTALERSIPGARRAEAAHPRVAPASPTSSTEGLAAELALLRRARDAHAAGDSASSEQALAEHARLFPSGVLRAEREGTRALLRCEARPDPTIASEFERGFGGSPLLGRVRAACGVEER